MSFLSRLLGQSEKANLPAPHAVVVTFNIADIDMESTGYEDSELCELEDKLTEALGDADAGEFWENEFRADSVLSTYTGPDADRIFQVVRPVLRASRLGRKARVTLRQGAQGAPEREVPVA